LRVALICPSYDEKLPSIMAMVSKYFHSRELTKALSKRVGQAIWIQGYGYEGSQQIDTVQLKLFKARPHEGGLIGLMSEHVDSQSLANIIHDVKPDHVHITGLLPRDILQIAEVCAPYTAKLSASFHGGHPSDDPAFFNSQKDALKILSFILFNSHERASIFQTAGLIDSTTKLAICPETSSFFTMKDRRQTRRKTEMHGNPVCVATSRLHPIKDPLTLLKGFDFILSKNPHARLYWVFQTDELLSDVNKMLESSGLLKNAVQLRGAIEFESIEDFYNSADFFLQASLDEIGGNSLVEAMACGTIPVVTNIPSFRYLTGNDRFGTLFETGDAAGLARIVTDIPAGEYTNYSKKIRGFFDENLSFDTIARTITENMA